MIYIEGMATKPKIGRPEGRTYPRQVLLRMTNDMDRDIRSYAIRKHIGLGEAIRRLIDRALKAERR